MVVKGLRAQPPSSAIEGNEEAEEQDSEDDESVASSLNNSDADVGAVVLADDANKSKFENICVSNSNDVHFGNKTFYQGPVTIKQIVYASNAIENNSETSACRLAINNVPKETENDSSLVLDSANLPVDLDSTKQPNVPTYIHVGNAQSHSGVTKGTKWLQNFSQKHFILVVILVTVLIASLLAVMGILFFKHYSPQETHGAAGVGPDTSELDDANPASYIDDGSKNVTLSGKLKIVSRLEWLAQPPVKPANPLTLPVPYVIICHTATESCKDQASCTFHVRFVQTFHIDSRKWWDIGYNFLIGGDGYAYEGRGWKSEGAHTYGYNARSIGIALIGTFNDYLPPARQIKAARQIIEKGVKMGYIASNYTLLAASQVSQTQSPGTLLAENLKTWPHWAEAPQPE